MSTNPPKLCIHLSPRQGAARVLAKDGKALKTRLQRIADGIAKEVPKKLIATVIDESAAGVLGEVVGEALST